MRFKTPENGFTQKSAQSPGFAAVNAPEKVDLKKRVLIYTALA